MKTLLSVCIIGIALSIATNISRAQNIFANVDGDTVTIWETQADRNCGAMYRMVIDEFNHTLNWYQIDTGATAVCMCIFDLAVTYGPLEAGSYTANIYYTDAWSPNDTIYEGSVDFMIGSSGREMNSGGILSQFQSDCHGLQGIEKDEEFQSFRIFPIPAKKGQSMHLEATGIHNEAVLEIYSSSGLKIYSKQYIGKGIIKDQWQVEQLFPGPGVYVFSMRDSKGITNKLIPVL